MPYQSPVRVFFDDISKSPANRSALAAITADGTMHNSFLSEHSVQPSSVELFPENRSEIWLTTGHAMVTGVAV